MRPPIVSLGLLSDYRMQDWEGTRVVFQGYKEEQPGEEKEGKEGREEKKERITIVMSNGLLWAFFLSLRRWFKGS
jgi:hypothetical protein